MKEGPEILFDNNEIIRDGRNRIKICHTCRSSISERPIRLYHLGSFLVPLQLDPHFPDRQQNIDLWADYFLPLRVPESTRKSISDINMEEDIQMVESGSCPECENDLEVDGDYRCILCNYRLRDMEVVVVIRQTRDRGIANNNNIEGPSEGSNEGNRDVDVGDESREEEDEVDNEDDEGESGDTRSEAGSGPPPEEYTQHQNEVFTPAEREADIESSTRASWNELRRLWLRSVHHTQGQVDQMREINEYARIRNWIPSESVSLDYLARSFWTFFGEYELILLD